MAEVNDGQRTDKYIETTPEFIMNVVFSPLHVGGLPACSWIVAQTNGRRPGCAHAGTALYVPGRDGRGTEFATNPTPHRLCMISLEAES